MNAVLSFDVFTSLILALLADLARINGALAVDCAHQMFIGDGAKLVRDAFALAKEKAPAIIFIDELDAVGTKRFDSDKAGDREVQRTMLELLNQMDGFSAADDIKVRRGKERRDEERRGCIGKGIVRRNKGDME